MVDAATQGFDGDRADLSFCGYFAHATHEVYFGITWKITPFTLQERARMAPFRLVPDGFRRASIEILYDRAVGRTARAGFRLRFSRLLSSCYVP